MIRKAEVYPYAEFVILFLFDHFQTPQKTKSKLTMYTCGWNISLKFLDLFQAEKSFVTQGSRLQCVLIETRDLQQEYPLDFHL